VQNLSEIKNSDYVIPAFTLRADPLPRPGTVLKGGMQESKIMN